MGLFHRSTSATSDELTVEVPTRDVTSAKSSRSQKITRLAKSTVVPVKTRSAVSMVPFGRDNSDDSFAVGSPLRHRGRVEEAMGLPAEQASEEQQQQQRSRQPDDPTAALRGALPQRLHLAVPPPSVSTPRSTPINAGRTVKAETSVVASLGSFRLNGMPLLKTDLTPTAADAIAADGTVASPAAASSPVLASGFGGASGAGIAAARGRMATKPTAGGLSSALGSLRSGWSATPVAASGKAGGAGAPRAQVASFGSFHAGAGGVVDGAKPAQGSSVRGGISSTPSHAARVGAVMASLGSFYPGATPSHDTAVSPSGSGPGGLSVRPAPAVTSLGSFFLANSTPTPRAGFAAVSGAHAVSPSAGVGGQGAVTPSAARIAVDTPVNSGLAAVREEAGGRGGIKDGSVSVRAAAAVARAAHLRAGGETPSARPGIGTPVRRAMGAQRWNAW